MSLKKSVLVTIIGLLAIQCSKPSFSNMSTSPVNTGSGQGDPTPVTPPSPPICEPGEVSVPVPTKILFVVDQSGSNATGPYEHPDMPTDVDKKFREGVISQFFSVHGSKSHLQWGFITFNNKSAHAFIHDSKNKPIFSDGTALESALTQFEETKDVGDTPYKAALTMVRDMIKADLLTSPKGMQYRVAFLTDGYPTDYCPSSGSCYGNSQTALILKDLVSIVALAPSQAIKFSSVYYGFPDAGATTRLQLMSKAGNGQFVDVNVNGNISLDDVIQVPDDHCVKN